MIGIDRDPQALELAERAAGAVRRPVHRRARGLRRDRRTCSTTSACRRSTRVLFDLGVSSMQLDVRERGFAYAEDAPLDMRMDGTVGITAADVLNTYDAADLTRDPARVRRGEVRPQDRRRRRARARAKEPFTSSGRLVELLYAEIPAPARRTGGHPAKRTFQALRMEVNDELAVLRRAMPGGDRRDQRRRPRGRRVLPLAGGPAGQAGVRRRDPQRRPGRHAVRAGGARAGAAPGHPGREKASPDEISENPRAASVRLRAIERVARQGSSSMSSTGHADPVAGSRGSPRRRSSGPASRSSRAGVRAAARVPFLALVSMVLLGGVVGLLLFNTSMQQASFATTALEQQSTRLAAREQSLSMDLDRLRNPQRIAGAAQRARHGPGVQPGVPPARHRQGHRRAVPATPTPAPDLRRPPAKPAVLNPQPTIVTVDGAARGRRRGRQLVRRHGRRQRRPGRARR